MISQYKLKIFLNLVLLLALLVNHNPVYSNESKSEKLQGEKYHSFENQMQDVDSILVKAKKSNKLALIVMGANWCHDSRSLARKLFSSEVKETIESNYELLFIDVGFMEKVKPVITRFGMPIIYSTPTALIIEPNSELLINRHNLHSIRDTDLVSEQGIKNYFNDIAINRYKLTKALSFIDTKVDTQILTQLNLQIDEFEMHQATRIYQAYDIVGPLIKERKAGVKNKNFRKYWKSASTLRYKITDDLDKLRAQAIKIAKVENSKEKLDFPIYPKFAWE